MKNSSVTSIFIPFLMACGASSAFAGPTQNDCNNAKIETALASVEIVNKALPNLSANNWKELTRLRKLRDEVLRLVGEIKGETSELAAEYRSLHEVTLEAMEHGHFSYQAGIKSNSIYAASALFASKFVSELEKATALRCSQNTRVGYQQNLISPATSQFKALYQFSPVLNLAFNCLSHLNEPTLVLLQFSRTPWLNDAQLFVSVVKEITRPKQAIKLQGQILDGVSLKTTHFALSEKITEGKFEDSALSMIMKLNGSSVRAMGTKKSTFEYQLNVFLTNEREIKSVGKLKKNIRSSIANLKQTQSLLKSMTHLSSDRAIEGFIPECIDVEGGTQPSIVIGL